MRSSTISSPLSGALHIDVLPMPLGGTLGLVHCPGRRGEDGSGQLWLRELSADVQHIKTWGASTVLTLISEPEMARLGVPDLPQAVKEAGLRWAHVPIPDFEPPNLQSMQAWELEIPHVMSKLARGEKVVVHCAAGLGRTGTVAASLLVLQGLSGEAAITRVRQVRPGTLETVAQEEFVRTFKSRARSA